MDGIKLLVWPDESGSAKIVRCFTVLLSLNEVSVPVIKGTVCFCVCEGLVHVDAHHFGKSQVSDGLMLRLRSSSTKKQEKRTTAFIFFSYG